MVAGRGRLFTSGVWPRQTDYASVDDPPHMYVGRANRTQEVVQKEKDRKLGGGQSVGVDLEGVIRKSWK